MCVGTSNPHAGYAGMFVLVLGEFIVKDLAFTLVNLSASTRH